MKRKNLECGEGGAIPINDPALPSSAARSFAKKAPIAAGSSAAKSTNTLGSISVRVTFLSDLLAAFLFAQLEARVYIQSRRKSIYAAVRVNDLLVHGR